MTPSQNIYDQVALKMSSIGLLISPEAIREIDKYLNEVRIEGNRRILFGRSPLCGAKPVTGNWEGRESAVAATGFGTRNQGAPNDQCPLGSFK